MRSRPLAIAATVALAIIGVAAVLVGIAMYDIRVALIIGGGAAIAAAVVPDIIPDPPVRRRKGR